ncbi:C2H2-type zinc finger protein [Aspergillus clavatus NRRL 1]|uniref:C2H2 type zinc finger domain protein n=1 Tax=Aspergillus clavatus (strain ATCC 1007 / CBS 513.65 / DSM 816 / NCTC 3887 / NRRL 1 / QM 1276 / 107) TaxID=344612 RepID=A1CC70_ASPCL|nr:C2H2 type zinc finger domain protein [Aspergillus clavatus NRRL 1]EAW12127.1 C2H2 type zinc finger domain protein [Aspergillus clavatus NRRL 1]
MATPSGAYLPTRPSSVLEPIPHYPSNVVPEERVTLRMTILLSNGVRVDHQFTFPAMNIANCIIHGEGEMYSVEITHRCSCRRLLHEELVRMLPGFLRENDVYWFRTRNPETNIHHTCLFDGAELEMQLVTSHVPECGFCFARRAFIAERDAFDRQQMSNKGSSSSPRDQSLSPGWTFREPSDTERLRVNRHGWEIMFVLHPDARDGAVTVSRLKMELCRILSIADPRRIILTSGPFVWGVEFQEDGKDYYSTYFMVNVLPPNSNPIGMSTIPENNSRPHRCVYCGLSFKRSEHLKRHVRRHTKERPFRCRICGESFSRKELHDRHHRTRHGATSSIPLPEIVETEPPSSSTAARSSQYLADSAQAATPQDSSPSQPHPQQQYLPSVEGPAGSTLQAPLTGETPRLEPVYLTGHPGSPAFQEHAYPVLTDRHRDSRLQTPLGSETPPWLKLPSGLEFASLLSALNRSPLSTSLPTPLRLCTPQSEALFEQDRNEAARLGIEKALEGLRSVNIVGGEEKSRRFEIPDMESLYRYWHMFFEIPHKNLPFAHPRSENYQIPAIAIGVLADGAMYCDEPEIGQMLFEASRRMVAHHMNTLYTRENKTIPIWIFTTLLLNCVFGLPGGKSSESDITLGSLDSLINLARVIESGPAMDLVDQACTMEEKWQSYIEGESHRRSILCFIVVSGLWSVAYEPIVNVLDFPFSLIEFPWSETLWNARSAVQWHVLYQDPQSRSPGSWSENVEALLFGKPRPLNGLASLCLVVGLLLYIDGLRREAVLDIVEINSYLQHALDKWFIMHDRTSLENLAINHLCYPAAYYLRISLVLDVRQTMDLMRSMQFAAMRKVLQEGDLIQAAAFARAAMVPWAISRRNQTSMVAMPCGCTDFLGVVITEWAINVLSTQPEDSPQREALRAFENSIREYWPVVPFASAVDVWRAVRRIIANGPGL